jgi:thioredoxin-dependent peroxiredoxin
MVELRKRKAPVEPAPAPLSKKKTNPVKDVIDKAKAVIKDKEQPAAASNTSPPTVGAVVDLEGFGGEVETHDGNKTTLKKLVNESSNGVVLFTYPKASTPGCKFCANRTLLQNILLIIQGTKQACLFRDDWKNLTSTGFAIYGLSNDSPKANTTFKTKQNLPYTLLCDPSRSLITAIGLGATKGKTTRGVFVIDKDGKVLAAEPGGPAPTVEVVKKLISSDTSGEASTTAETKVDATDEESKEKADVAAEVADTAAKIDS